MPLRVPPIVLMALLVVPAGRAAELYSTETTLLGGSTALSGPTSLVGGAEAVSRGAAYLFRDFGSATGRVPSVAKLVSSDRLDSDNFGNAVSLVGGMGIVGAPFYDFTTNINHNQGAAYLFRNLDSATGTVNEVAKLRAADGTAGDNFGSAVGLSGDMALIGADHDDIGSVANQGSAYVFRDLRFATGTLTQSAKLQASDGGSNDLFGGAVSFSGNTGLVGAEGERDFHGAAYLYRDLNTATGTVSQTAKLVSSDAATGDTFGRELSLSGTMALVAASGHDGSTGGSGAVYLFRGLDTATGTKTETARLVPSDLPTNDAFGFDVSLSGNVAMAIDYDGAYFFRDLDQATGTVTEAVKLTITGAQTTDLFNHVALEGDQFVLTASVSNQGLVLTAQVSAFTTLDTGNASRVIERLSFTSAIDWTVGQQTSGNSVTLSAGNTARVTAAGKNVFIGKNAGANENRLQVEGTLFANQVAVGAPVGTTGNVLAIGASGKVDATTIDVGSGGRVVFTAGASIDRLGPATALTLESGAALQTGGASEGSSATGAPAGFGSLALAGGSSVDFGTGALGSTLLATTGDVFGDGEISIWNWTGSAGLDSGAVGNDRLLFFSANLTPAELSLFRFYGDSNMLIAAGGQIISYHGFREIVPVPEPSVALYLLLAVGGWKMIRRRRGTDRPGRAGRVRGRVATGR